MDLENKSWYSTSSCNSEDIYQQNDRITKDYYDLAEDHDDINRRAHLVENNCEKEKSF